MLEHCATDESIDEVCAGLRDLLTRTRGLDRRDFLRALIETAAGSWVP